MGTLRPSWDQSPQTQAGHLTTKSSLVHPIWTLWAASLRVTWSLCLLMLRFPLQSPLLESSHIQVNASSPPCYPFVEVGICSWMKGKGMEVGRQKPWVCVLAHIQLSFTTTDFPSFPPCLSNQSWGKRNPAASWLLMITTAIKSVL